MKTRETKEFSNFFLLFIGGCIPNLHDKPGKVTLCPRQLICRFYFLFQTACHRGTKATPIPKRQCLEWGGIVSMSCLALCMHIAFHCIKIHNCLQMTRHGCWKSVIIIGLSWHPGIMVMCGLPQPNIHANHVGKHGAIRTPSDQIAPPILRLFRQKIYCRYSISYGYCSTRTMLRDCDGSY